MNRLLQLFMDRRGYTPDYIASIFDTTHAPIHGTDKLSEQLKAVHDAGETIVIAPDFDCDGVMSATVLYAGLSELGFNAYLYVPDPNLGYGTGAHDVDAIVAWLPQTRAIITCDNGISAREAATRAHELGIKFFITDHHLEDEQTSARAYADALVDPKELAAPSAFPDVCGAAVAYFCLRDYAQRYTDRDMQDKINRLRVFAGVGTVSDVMPATHENRALIQDAEAITRLCWPDRSRFCDDMQGSIPYRSVFFGLRSLVEAFRDLGKAQSPDNIDADFFGYYLAPAINAVRRIGDNMRPAYGVFLPNGIDDMSQLDCANKLLALNELRKKLVEDTLDKIAEDPGEFAPWGYIIDAPAGINGLVANKLMELNGGIPTLVVQQHVDGTISGSGRAPDFFNYNSLSKDTPLFCAGHEQAFGVRADSLDAFATGLNIMKTRFEETYATLVAQGAVTMLAHDIEISGYANRGDANLDAFLLAEFVDELSRFAPFGHGFEAPVIGLEFDAADAYFRTVGKENQHLAIDLPNTISVVGWNLAKVFADLGIPHGRVALRGSFALNRFGDASRVQFKIDTIEAWGDADAA